MNQTKTFQAGQIVFREGEQSREAYRIVSGRVAIAMAGATKPIILAQLTTGDIFGEMGMVDERPRSASAVAVENTTVEVVTTESFSHMIMNEPKKLIPYLSVFFERLRSTNDRLRMELKAKGAMKSAAVPAAAPAAAPSGEAVRAQTGPVSVELQPANEKTIEACGGVALAVTKFPFRIGRRTTENDPFAMNDLQIADQAPYQVSRNHCAIEREGDRYFINDRGSSMGTIVNDTAIGSTYNNLQSDLVVGKENLLVVGDDHSQYRFKVVFKKS